MKRYCAPECVEISFVPGGPAIAASTIDYPVDPVTFGMPNLFPDMQEEDF